MNIVVMKYSGDKPAINEEVMITSTGTVRKSIGNDMSRVIGDRVYDDGTLADDEINICLFTDVIDNRNPQPLFTSKVDARGRLTIRSDVRRRMGIKPGGLVDVTGLEKVVDDE